MKTNVLLEGRYAEALEQLRRQDGQPWPVAVVRDLIRDAAKRRGVWPPAGAEDVEAEEETKPIATPV